MKAIRNLRTTSTYSENLPDPTPAYEPSPKYEPPAEKYNPAPNSIPASNHHPPLVLKEEKTAWTKWTIPEGDQSECFSSGVVITNINLRPTKLPYTDQYRQIIRDTHIRLIQYQIYLQEEEVTYYPHHLFYRFSQHQTNIFQP